MKKIAIIGAGISGLSVGYFLHKAGADVLIFEEENEVGGKIKTINEKGYTIDLGPNTAIETHDLFNQIFEEMKIYGKVIYASDASKKRFILRDGKLHNLPMNPIEFIRTDLFSCKAKLRLILEPFIRKCEESLTVAEFVKKRFGAEFLNYAIDPFVAGVYAGSPEKLSLKYAFPKLFQLQNKYRSLFIGAIFTARERKKRIEKAKTEAPIFSFIGGMKKFPLVFHNILKEKIRLNAKIKSIIKKLDRFEIELDEGKRFEEGFDEIILSVPAYSAGSILKNLSPALAEVLALIEYPPVAVITTIFKEKDIGFNERGFGFLVPKIENRKILGSLWNSYMFKDRVPTGYALFTTFIGGARQPELVLKSDDELIHITLNELREIMKIEAKPEDCYIKKWQKAIPQYNIGYENIIEEINKFRLNEKRIHFCANYIGGISIGDCLMNAKKIADEIIP